MPDTPTKAIFLSYARDDAAAARRLAEALRSSGLDVWFDENELRGGDSWDAKIRKQINDCALFVPVISQHTEERAKGYFRLEWKLAVDQTHLLADGVPFIAPVVIDDTRENGTSVPAEFLRVQWMRLPGALPTPQFVEQVKRLLDAPQKSAMEPGRPRPGQRGEGAASPTSQQVGRRIPAAAWVVAGALVIAAIAVFLGRQSPNAGAGTRPPTAENSTATVSEARQLVAKARALYEPWDLATRDDFVLAEQLLKKATDLNPTDGDAWAAYATMALGTAYNYDRTDERRVLARTLAERAVKLAPDSRAARFAYAYSLRLNDQTRNEAERLLREEATRQPTNKLVLRTLGSALSISGKLDQALVYLDKATALPGGDPIAHYLRARTYQQMGRPTEAEAAVDEALALAPTYVKAHTMKLSLLLDYHGDISRAKAHLATVPSSFFTDENGATTAGLIWLYAQDAAKCLEALRFAPEYPVLNVPAGFAGPKAYLTGLVLQTADKVDAARTEWRAALRIIEQRLAAQPNVIELLVWKAVLLAALGERTDAESLLHELIQRMNAGDGRIASFEVAKIRALLKNSDEAVISLEMAMKPGIPFIALRNQLRFDPVWDPLRGNPRFEALLKATEQRK